MYITLLMSVHILRTQSWVGGFTEPPATDVLATSYNS